MVVHFSGWSAVFLVLSLYLMCGIPAHSHQAFHGDTPLTIDEAMREAPGGGYTAYTGRGKRFAGAPRHGMVDDMALTERQHSRLYSGVRSRSDGRLLAKPWTDGIIPYEISPNNFTDDQIHWILRAMRHWEDVTCVRFRPATPDDVNFVTIRTGKGCWSHLGMLGGNQIVNLDPYCFWIGIIEHELGHTIGLIHEHQRPQRDAYIRVDYYAVQGNFVSALKKYARGSDDKLGLPYDYTSVMHYMKTAFSSNGHTQTLFPRDPTKEDVIGMILGPSYLDAKLVNMMYDCSDKCGSRVSCPDDCVKTADCRCLCQEDMPKEHCEDKNENCTEWMQKGECRGNSFYMYTFCRKSCGLCKSDGSTPRLPCINGNEECENWARGQQCELNPGYMLRRCRLACGVCEVDDDLSPKGPCQDKNATCAELAGRGQCVRDPTNMLKDCTKSCDFCPEDVGNDPFDHRGECSNVDGVCYYFADSNLCGRHYAWMSVNCRQACGYCDRNVTLPEGCVDTDKNCHDWSFRGECEYNPGYMLHGCKMSCDECPGLNKPPEQCLDYNLECEAWAKRYECWGNPKWMAMNCPKSCKVCPGDPPTQKPPCMDYSSGCEEWARIGECEKNPLWMGDYCKLSCKKCTPSENETIPCEDDNERCSEWVQGGDCTDAYMRRNCKKSCNLCPGAHATQSPVVSGPCRDDNNNCPNWAHNGDCVRNSGYMNEYCKKSCRICLDEQNPDETTRNPCADDDPECPEWARYGDCETNPGYMEVHCKTSCNICDGVACFDEHRACKDWANEGHCDKTPGYMRFHCRKSCHECQ